jgi:hypothetical protein
MPFTVSPAEAQAMQEDQAQLLIALTQATRGLVSILNQPPTPVVEPPETLRIQMGRRLVYGQLVHGQFRNELDADRMKAIFDAIQRPATEGIDPDQYRGKIPAIEIKDGETVLFREERDGTVTVNQIQFQLSQSPLERSTQNGAAANGELKPVVEPLISAPEQPSAIAQNMDWQDAVVAEQSSAIAQDTDWKVDAIAQAAEYLLNPLGDDAPLYDTVSVRGYQITQQGDHLKVTQDTRLILESRNGEILEHQVNQNDWEVFQGLMMRPVASNIQQDNRTEQAHAITNGNGVHPAIAVAEQEIAKLPEGTTKQLLTVTAQDWKQQLSQSLQQGVGWLASRPEAWRNHQIAHAALELFKRGYERTGEKSYQAGDYTISLRGQHVYHLSDSAGELMSFKASKSLLQRHTIQVLAMGDRLGTSHQQQLRNLQFNSALMPQGSLGSETVYATKISRVEQTVKDFLRGHVGANVWDKEGGRFKLEVGDDFLQITDKQGDRGTVFQRQEGQVFSKLGASDFKHFERLATRMQQVAHQSSAPSMPSETISRPKTAALEIG